MGSGPAAVGRSAGHSGPGRGVSWAGIFDANGKPQFVVADVRCNELAVKRCDGNVIKSSAKNSEATNMTGCRAGSVSLTARPDHRPETCAGVAGVGDRLAVPGGAVGAGLHDQPGHAPLPTRLMAGLAILKHIHDLSYEVLCSSGSRLVVLPILLRRGVLPASLIGDDFLNLSARRMSFLCNKRCVTTRRFSFSKPCSAALRPNGQ